MRITDKELSSFLSTLKEVVEPFTKNDVIDAVKKKSRKCLARVALDTSSSFVDRCFKKLIKANKVVRVENSQKYKFVQKKKRRRNGSGSNLGKI
eukprot:TRINITY_DN6215_c0_g1_i2.p1 TRINITY_DN6215_c0_g1~~TRINITY_DN6215_c0_g1_i2.p1  ORF type:complete len:94 (-),score=13.48 TRINITY_DN6215_c0_g1_i2:938-1219(-)